MIGPQRVVMSSDPVEVQDYVWEAEMDGIADGAITEQEVGVVLDQARAKWPLRWEFEALTSSHYVRTGDAAQAQAHFDRARVLYAENPAIMRGTRGTAVAATVLGRARRRARVRGPRRRRTGGVPRAAVRRDVEPARRIKVRAGTLAVVRRFPLRPLRPELATGDEPVAQHVADDAPDGAILLDREVE